MKFICWNVNGIRAAQRKGFIDYLKRESPDVIALQETKAHIEQLDDELVNIEGYRSHFVSGEKRGYSGVALYIKEGLHPKIGHGCEIQKFDCEGRVISADFGDYIFYNMYFPNGGRGPDRVKYKLDFCELLLDQWQELRAEGRSLILCGDFNTAHHDIDVARPDRWASVTGFLPIERAWLDKITEMGYVDIFRKYHPEPEQYTYWDNFRNMRENNIGWRIDYFMVTEELIPRISSAEIHPTVMGSDHCPISLVIE